MTIPGRDVHSVSLNLAGLNCLVKRQRFRQFLKKLDCDVFCAQTTHLRKQEEHYIKGWFFGYLVHAPALVKKKKEEYWGISNRLHFQQQATISDAEGHYLLIQGLMGV